MRPSLPGSFTGDPWPTRDQRLLLDAGLCPGERGISAFREWRVRVDPEGEFGWSVVRLLPLVYHTLQAQGVRDPLMARLKGVYRRAWSETHRLFHTTAPAVERLAAAGCELLTIKGVPLTLSYYRNHALRPMADLDVVVRPEQRSTAIAVLRAAGFSPIFPVCPDRLRFTHALQFVHPDGAQIDLHWHILFETPRASATAACWAASEPVEFMGIPVRQPNPTDLLLQTIIHGVRSNKEPPIRWIPDAMVILRTRALEIRWDRLVAFAREHRLTSRLGLGLAYLRKIYDAPIPGRQLDSLGAISWVERLENTVMMSPPGRFDDTALGTQWVALTEYCRYADRGGPWSFARGYSEFLRFRLELGGRRELVPMILRGIGKRLRSSMEAEAAW